MLRLLRNRLKDPLLGSYTISFLFWNWKPILILVLDTRPIVNRIDYISSTYFGDIISKSISFGAPFLVSLFSVYVYPFIREKVVEFTESRILSLKKIIKDISSSLDYEDNMKKLSNDRKRLAEVDTLINDLYNKNRGLLEYGTFYFVYCTDGEVGDCVRLDGKSAKLAVYVEFGDSVLANGVIVEKRSNGFVTVQTSGQINWHYLQNVFKKPKESGQKFYLGNNPGEMTSKRAVHRKNQLIGTFFAGKHGIAYLEISFSLE
ncbi:hypothetical protein [Leptospira licerasiae]|uniref:hypothetical protein n=1 Tax=Leptospira licerasiae TaxID=447106 RepID=UPI0010826DEA|nr:hypothetical protein [Leptospira licerasiae]TGM89555.1 hypothetical protein EHR05_10665 [Leptospira licerasiae]